MVVEKKEITSDDPEFLECIPTILYKYRCWDNAYHKRMLTETELYFASANTFNDPYDCSMPYKWRKEELTEDNIFRKYYSSLKEMHPEWEEHRIHELCYNEQRQGLFHDENHIERVNSEWLERQYRMFGIVSLTSKSSNFLMWSHYADSHKGFAVGFDKYVLFESTRASLSPMIYQREIPSYGLFDDLTGKAITQLHTKSDVWEYEQEYRLITSGQVNTAVILPQEAVREIIMGLKMPHKTKLELIALASKKYPDASVFDTQLNKNEFKIDLMQVR